MNSGSTRYDRLSSAGHAVFGNDWQSPMARALGVGGRHLRRWVSGERPVPAWVNAALVGILKEAAAESAGRAVALERLSGSLTTHAGVA